MSNQPDLTKFSWCDILEYSNREYWRYIASGYVINRIFERGNEEQILEIIRFYGIETIKNEIRLDGKSPFKSITVR